MLEQSSEVSVEVNRVDIRRQNVLGKGKKQYKGQRAGVRQACWRAKSRDASVAGRVRSDCRTARTFRLTSAPTVKWGACLTVILKDHWWGLGKGRGCRGANRFVC